MLFQIKKILTAIMLCCLVLAISSISVTGKTKSGYPDLYIFFDAKFTEDTLNLSEKMTNRPTLNVIEIVLTDFAQLTNQKTNQHIKNHQQNYQSILDSTKDALKDSLNFKVKEEEMKKKIQTEIEEDATNFLEDILSK